MAMWEVFYKRWLDLLLWWTPKKEAPSREAKGAPARRPQGAKVGPAEPTARPERKRRAPEPSAAPAAKPAAAGPKPVAPPVPDDLTVIKGIGPAVQNKLRALGITTFADLAAADPDAILRQLKGSQPLTKGRVQAWTEAARARART
jgi:predicted flap endonuclease-1-like 5' DNA nuclease